MNHIDPHLIDKKLKSYTLNNIRKTYIFLKYFVYIDKMSTEIREKEFVGPRFYDEKGYRIKLLPHKDNDTEIIKLYRNKEIEKMRINYDCRNIIVDLLLYNSIQIDNYILFLNWYQIDIIISDNNIHQHSIGCNMIILKKKNGKRYKVLPEKNGEICNACAKLFGLKGFNTTVCDSCENMVFVAIGEVNCGFASDPVDKTHDFVDETTSSSENDDDKEIPKEYLFCWKKRKIS